MSMAVLVVRHGNKTPMGVVISSPEQRQITKLDRSRACPFLTVLRIEPAQGLRLHVKCLNVWSFFHSSLRECIFGIGGET